MEFFVGLFNDTETVAALWVMGFFVGALGANEVISDMENSLNSFQITFWIGWILLMSGCVALFCYFDNRWLED